MTADRMARRETPVKRYSFDPLVKVTRTVPVIGLAVTLRAALLNLESMGSMGRLLWLMWLVYRVRVGGRCPPCATSQFGHHGVHFIGIDGDAIPCHAVTGLPKHPPDLPFHHAANELIPRGLIIAAELYTRLGGVVEELIILNPEGSVPGFVGCPTVVGGEGSGHVVSFVVDLLSLQGQVGGLCPLCASLEIDCQALSLPHARATVTGSSDTVCLCLCLVCYHHSGQVINHTGAETSHTGQGHAPTAATCRTTRHSCLDAIGAASEIADCLVLVVQCHGWGRLVCDYSKGSGVWGEGRLCQIVRRHIRQLHQGNDGSNTSRTKPHAQNDTERQITLFDFHLV